MPNGIPDSILTDNGPQFTAKFFDLFCTKLSAKNLTTNTYHSQTNGQTERFNRTLVTRLRHFVSDHPNDYDYYVQPLTYTYNMQVRRSTGLTPFDLVLARHPPNPIIWPPRPVLSNNRPKRTARAVKDEPLDQLQTIFARAVENLATAQGRYKRDHDNFDRTIASSCMPRRQIISREPARTCLRRRKYSQ